MLHRAASNACSWWWASHIRTKQSKWLEQNLHDMEEKVEYMMRIIEGDGDSFAKRAEMYYKKRPELVEQVEESFRAYRALAEKYDHLSKDFQGANRTIASIFPERVQYTIDDGDSELDFFPQESLSAKNPNQFSSEFDGSSKLGIPQVPKFPEKSSSMKPSLIRKTQLKKNASNASRAISTPKSGLNKTEALKEIDMLQKEILARQTEMEFVKSLYQRECKKYSKMESSITTMQKRVGNLQDEFGIGTTIEDNEARTLMATTALKSCQETLTKMQGEQEKTIEETKLEKKRIKKVDIEFESLKCKLLSNPTDHHESNELHKDSITETELTISDQLVACTAKDKHDIELLDQKIREYMEMNSNNSFTISELAEKIDELVNKIVALETSVSSQTSLVRRLKSETDVLQANVQQLEEEKGILVGSSENMKKKIQELEAEIARVKNLNQNLEIQNNSLQTQFAEASCNLGHLFGKLQTTRMDEEIENSEFVDDVMMVDPDVKSTTFSTGSRVEGRKVETLKLGDIFIDEEQKQPILANKNISFFVEKEKEPIDKETIEKSQPTFFTGSRVEGRKEESLKLNDISIDEEQKQPILATKNISFAVEKEKEPIDEETNEISQPQTKNTHLDLETNEVQDKVKHPTLKELFLRGLEDREKNLLEEYTSVLRDYKDVRNKLSEVEQKNRDSIFDLSMQVKELKDAISSKDDVIKSLVNNAETNARDMDQEQPQESIHEAPSSLFSQSSTPYQDRVSTPNLNGERSIEPTERSHKSLRNVRAFRKKEDVKKKSNGGNKSITMSPTEEKYRSHIDGQLEVNLEFWLRFSTSVHQIQKFQTSIRDLQSELQKLREKNTQEECVKHNQSIESDARPIYTHFREIQTELSLWLEHNAVLKDELCNRFESLSNIQNEISRITDECSGEEKAELSDYQAAKFLGEVLNMKQENKKIVDELHVGLGRVEVLQAQVEKALERLDQEFGISSKNIESTAIIRPRIPLRSFLFGVKLKKQKPSFFSCVSPQLEKEYSDLANKPLPQ